MTGEVIVRADASQRIGYGHIGRCLALADVLARRGRPSTFVMRHWSEWTADRIEAAGHQVVVLEKTDAGGENEAPWLDVSWRVDARQTIEAVGQIDVAAVVVDQYGLDHRWERFVGNQLDVPVVVIDGTGTRRHHCQLLVDPTYRGESGQTRWEKLVPSHTRVLAGPRFALLRPEFTLALDRRTRRTGDVDKILIAFGGSDEAGATEVALEVVGQLDSYGLEITVVAGAAKPGVEPLRRRCAAMENVQFHHDTDEMARLMADADLAVGGAGTMMWERAFLGLPAVVVAIASHQIEIGRQAAEAGAVDYVGAVDEISLQQLRRHIENLVENPDQVRRLSEHGRALMGDADQVGTAAVAEILEGIIDDSGAS